MKSFSEFQEEMNKKIPPVTGLGGGGGGTDSITDKSPAKSFKKRVGDVAKVLTRPFHKKRVDPTEKFATEGVASLAIKGGSKLIPALMTGIGAAGTIMQATKKDDDVINPKSGEVTKQRELLKKAEKKITKPKKGEKKKAKKVVDTFKKVRKIEGKTMMRNKEDMEILKKGPGDLVPKARKTYLDKLLKNLRKEEVAIANSMGGGGIAGSVEAGDEPPVKKNKRGSGMKNRKKKTYAYGGRGSRKMWMT